MAEPATARGRVRIEQGAKRVRAYLHGRLVADTIAPLLVWESPHYPTYYIPEADVRAELAPTGATEHSPSRGTAEILDVVTEAGRAPGAARRYRDSPLDALRTPRYTWTGMRWRSGWRRTSRYTRTRATRTRGSTSSPAAGTYAWSSTE